MAAPLIQAIRRIVRQAERRLRVDRALARGVALGVPAALLLAGALLTERLRGLPPGGLDWAYAAALGLPLAGLAWGLLTPVRRRHLATRVDTACGLQDRLGTAWAITAGGTRSPADGFPAAAVRDAEGHVDQADAALAVPLRLPGAFRALVLAVLAAAVAAFVPTPELGPTGHLPLLPRERPQLLDEEDVEVQREAATRLQREAREQKDRKLARVADELARLVDRLDGRDVERKHAFERLNKLERKLREGAEETKAAEKAAQEAVKEAAKALKRHEETKPLAEALEKGDLKAAEEALSKLADLMEKAPMTRGLLEKLAKAFEKTAEKLAQRFDSELRKELADEMKRLRELLRKQGLSEREKERLEELRRKLESLDEADPHGLAGAQAPGEGGRQAATEGRRGADRPAQGPGGHEPDGQPPVPEDGGGGQAAPPGQHPAAPGGAEAGGGGAPARRGRGPQPPPGHATAGAPPQGAAAARRPQGRPAARQAAAGRVPGPSLPPEGPGVAAPRPVTAAGAPPDAAEAADPPMDGEAVPSPMVGTAYLSPQPGDPPFVKVGDTVLEGQTLMIVEAMKVMNPITAPRAGTVKAVLVEDSQPVEYGDTLVVLM